MTMAYVYMVKTRAEATELDALLWRVLWSLSAFLAMCGMDSGSTAGSLN
jgi:hypothetical protein